MPDEMKNVIADFLEEFYGPVNWRQALNGERKLFLDTALRGNVGKVDAVTFSDGVRQIASPTPFDAISCADVLMMANKEKER